MINPEASLADALPAFPHGGIAYRGDSIMHSDGSLARESANYIVFDPQHDTSKTLADLALELQDGINFALQFSYPDEWGSNPVNPIQCDFSGYSQHYSANPNDLPVVSWGTESYAGQFDRLKRRRSGFYTARSFITTGSVRYDGKISDALAHQPITASVEDIQKIENSLPVPDNTLTRVATARRWKPSRKMTTNEYLGGPGRLQFHAQLGELMASRLITEITDEYAS